MKNGGADAVFHARSDALYPGDFLPPPPQEGVMLMLTYSELFQFCLVIIGIVGLFFQAKKK